MNDEKQQDFPERPGTPQEPESTQTIQSAIEKLVDEEAAVLPHVKKLSGEVAHAGKPAPAAPSRTAVPSGVPEEKSRASDWFFTFMCMNIPVVGWIYLLRLARGRGRTDRREFARAYLFYKLLFLLIGLIILIVVGLIAMNLLDKLLAYMQML